MSEITKGSRSKEPNNVKKSYFYSLKIEMEIKASN